MKFEIIKADLIQEALGGMFDENLFLNGIYKMWFTNHPEYFYVGRAKSTGKFKSSRGFRRRWLKHICDFRNKKHANLFLQRLFDKNGLDNLNFQILEICEIPECDKKELEWFDKVKPPTNFQSNKKYIKSECNLITEESKLKRCNARLGKKHSEETKKKISDAHKGIKQKSKLLDENIVYHILDNILLKSSTITKEFKRIHASPATVKLAIQYYFPELFETILKVSVNNMRIKIIEANTKRIPKSRTEDIMLKIISLYSQGLLIKDIRPIVNLNEDLIGSIIKDNLSQDERKKIRSKNAMRNNTRKNN